MRIYYFIYQREEELCAWLSALVLFKVVCQLEKAQMALLVSMLLQMNIFCIN